MDRKTAIATGAKIYQPDSPCINGHGGARYTRSGACLECLSEAKARAAAARGEEGGLIPLRIRLHPEDVAVVQALVAQMVQARMARKPPRKR